MTEQREKLIRLIREQMMSLDHPVSQWECDFADAILSTLGSQAVEPERELKFGPDSVSANLSGEWQPIATVPRENGLRMILAWDDCENLPYHWEVGRWSKTLGWVNTYGHAFSGEPTHWMIPSDPPHPAALATLPASPIRREGDWRRTIQDAIIHYLDRDEAERDYKGLLRDSGAAADAILGALGLASAPKASDGESGRG